MLLSLIPYHFESMFLFAAGGVCGVFVAWKSWKNLKYVKTVGTATFGAFLLAKGVGTFVGNFPALLENIQKGELDGPELEAALGGNMSLVHIAYFVGMVLFSIIGSCIQMKYTCVEEAKTGDIEGADEKYKYDDLEKAQ